MRTHIRAAAAVCAVLALAAPSRASSGFSQQEVDAAASELVIAMPQWLGRPQWGADVVQHFRSTLGALVGPESGCYQAVPLTLEGAIGAGHLDAQADLSRAEKAADRAARIHDTVSGVYDALQMGAMSPVAGALVSGREKEKTERARRDAALRVAAFERLARQRGMTLVNGVPQIKEDVDLLIRFDTMSVCGMRKHAGKLV